MPCSSCDNRRIYYEEHGKGHPVIFCHGNTSSSRMFSLLMPLYAKRSALHPDRLPRLWQVRQDCIISLRHLDRRGKAVQHLELDEVSLIGTSGGAWVVMNAAMMMKGGVSSIIADSFDGRTLDSSSSSDLTKERESAMKDEDARGFYEWCLGPDWQDCFHPPLKGNLSTKNRAGCPTGIGQPIRKNWSVAA